MSAALHGRLGGREKRVKEAGMKEKMKERTYMKESMTQKARVFEGRGGERVKPVQLHTQPHYTSVCACS